MIRLMVALAAGVLLAGCYDPLAPVPPGVAVQQADAADADAAALNVRLVRSLDAAAPVAIALLADPNERLTLAAARSVGRAPVRNDPALAQRALDVLAEASLREQRPAVLSAQVDAMVNVLANRGGLAGGELRDALAVAALEAVRSRSAGDFAAVRAADDEFLRAWSIRRPGRLGGNVYDGPGFKADRPKAPPRKRFPAYAETIHTVPIVAAGEVHVGDTTGRGGADYLIVDTQGRPDGLFVRITLYDHGTDLAAWSFTLAGDDRPICFPPGELADIDGDGRAEIVYVDRAGRVVVRGGDGAVIRRSEPFRTLDGEPYFGDRPASRPTTQPLGRGEPPGGGPAVPPPAPGRLSFANLRGGGPPGRRDLLLASGDSLLAITGQFQTLWHVMLDVPALPAAPTLLGDLDGDGCDEIVYGNVAIDHTGRVMWTWPHAVTAVAAGRLTPLPAATVLLADAGGRIAGFDAAGLLWQAGPFGQVRQLIVGRFLPPSSGQPAGQPGGRWAGVVVDQQAGGSAEPAVARPGPLLDAIGRSHLPTARRLVEPDVSFIRVDPLGLVADWNNDGLDEVWGHDKPAIPGWFRWSPGPPAPAVERIPQAARVIGLYDVDGDGVDELLYFQGNSLVVQRRG
jgi:hypothetical protein